MAVELISSSGRPANEAKWEKVNENIMKQVVSPALNRAISQIKQANQKKSESMKGEG